MKKFIMEFSVINGSLHLTCFQISEKETIKVVDADIRPLGADSLEEISETALRHVEISKEICT